MRHPGPRAPVLLALRRPRARLRRDPPRIDGKAAGAYMNNGAYDVHPAYTPDTPATTGEASSTSVTTSD